MAYTPDWESLAHALERAMATGITEDQAKRDLCLAVADKKIEVRVTIAASDHSAGGEVFWDGNIRVPPHLNPDDFDWKSSRPRRPWSIGPRLGQHYSWISGWKSRPIDLIELSTGEVQSIFSSSAKANTAESALTTGVSAREWLAQEMRASPEVRPKSKGDYLRLAQKKFRGLREREFERAWTDAIRDTGANWSTPGPVRRSPH